MTPNLISGTFSRFSEINGKAFFIFPDVTYGKELWVSDGTASGTMMVKDIATGTAHGAFADQYYKVFPFNNKALFVAETPAEGKELWISDGTTAGTTLVKDINPGSAGSITGFTQFTELNGKVYFRAKTAASGYELWVTDGTDAGTTMVVELNTSTADGARDDFQLAFNNQIYFKGTDGTSSGTWRTNGSAGNKELIFAGLDIQSGFATSTYFFYETSQLVSSNGNTNNYTILGPIRGRGSFMMLNNKVVFQGSDYEPWVTDNTTGGTMQLKDIYPGVGYSIAGVEIFTEPYNGKLYFPARVLSGNDTLYETDGTTGGTVVTPGYPTGWGAPDQLVKLGNSMYFVTTVSGTSNRELCKYFDASTNIITTSTGSLQLATYPNPASDQLFVELNKYNNSTAELFNLKGQLLQSITLQSFRTAIAIDHLTNGIYLLKVQNAEGVSISKIIKN